MLNFENSPAAEPGNIKQLTKKQIDYTAKSEIKHRFVSGLGQFHTNENDPEKPEKVLTPYLAIDYVGIRSMVDNPTTTDKAQAQWLIASSLESRNFKEQEENGVFWFIWADLDKKPPPMLALSTRASGLFPGCDIEIYNTRSATTENPKARIIVLIEKPLAFDDWVLCQQILNDKLQALSITPDRATERAAQLCYLPNRGEYYESFSIRNDKFFDPLKDWARDLAAKRTDIEAERLLSEERKQEAIKRRETIKPAQSNHNLIAEFNGAYPCEVWLTTAGYSQRGNKFCSPHSQSGSYAGSVKDNRYHTLSSSDPLYTESGAHDAFSCFTILNHGGDQAAALKDAGDNLLTIGSVSLNKAIQIEWAKANKPNPETANKNTESNPTGGHDEQTKPAFSLNKFSLRGSSQTMKRSMINEVFVLEKIAILGQVTVIYAKPNSGKTLITLKLLSESIEAGRLIGENVFYVNADDTYNGLIQKTELAEQYNFHMLAPGHNEFRAVDLIGYLVTMVKEKTASGKVIVLDTAKKFTDLMDKKNGSEFMKVARMFISTGGTMILLAHVNKHKDSAGKVIFAGTSDLYDDSDCAFTLDQVSMDAEIKTVLFENFKNRGNVSREIGFTYLNSENTTYMQLLNSIKPLDSSQQEVARQAKRVNDEIEQNKLAIDSIIEQLNYGDQLKCELVKAARMDTGASAQKINKIIANHCGFDYSKGHRWFSKPGDKNAKVYSVLKSENIGAKSENLDKTARFSY